MCVMGLTTRAQTAAPVAPSVTTLSALRDEAVRSERRNSHIEIEGVILWADSRAGRLILQDQTGIYELELNFRNIAPEPGMKLLISGNCFPRIEGEIIRPDADIVENDGLHIATEKSGAVFLQAGSWPILVDWFNAGTRSELKLDYSGPTFARQKIPDSALLHPATPDRSEPAAQIPGLDYSSYVGEWKRLPDFDILSVVKSGEVPNFDITVRTQDEFAGMRFSGLLNIPTGGLYTFWCSSDDGSRVRLGNVVCTALGKTDLPAPQALVIDAARSEQQDFSWARVAGRVISIRPSGEETELELKSGPARINIEVRQPLHDSISNLLWKQIAARGVAQSVYTVEGSHSTSRLLVQDWNQIHLAPGKVC